MNTMNINSRGLVKSLRESAQVPLTSSGGENFVGERMEGALFNPSTHQTIWILCVEIFFLGFYCDKVLYFQIGISSQVTLPKVALAYWNCP
jgi:hypothetical protein